MAYSFLSLKPPSRRLGRPASTVFNPLSAQRMAPTPTPDYGQQIAGFMSSPGMAAPQFAAGTPNASSTAPFTFSNSGSSAFGPLATPSLGAASFGGVSVDYSNDPIYSQARAYYDNMIQQAQAATLGSERQALIRYGSGSLLRKVLGDSASDADVSAADNNTYGTVQELGRWNTRALSGIDSNTNRNNLYFSSTRARDRGLQQEDMGRQTAATGNQLQDVLTGYVQGLLAQKQGAEASLMSAAEAAYSRAMQQAMYQASLAQAQPPAGGPTVAQSSGTSGINGISGGVPYAGAGGVVTPWWQRYGGTPIHYPYVGGSWRSYGGF